MLLDHMFRLLGGVTVEALDDTRAFQGVQRRSQVSYLLPVDDDETVMNRVRLQHPYFDGDAELLGEEPGPLQQICVGLVDQEANGAHRIGSRAV